jgi:hypothetical protein
MLPNSVSYCRAKPFKVLAAAPRPREKGRFRVAISDRPPSPPSCRRGISGCLRSAPEHERASTPPTQSESPTCVPAGVVGCVSEWTYAMHGCRDRSSGSVAGRGPDVHPPCMCCATPPPSDWRWQPSPCCVVHGPLPRCGSSTCRGTSQGVVRPVLGVLDRVLGVLVVIVVIIVVVIVV